MAKIHNIKVGFFALPPATRLVDARHGDHDVIELITVALTDETGATGIGYTFTGGHNGAAIHKGIEADIVPLLAGEDADQIAAIWDKIWWACHYGGRGGPMVLALSAVDIALWDLKAKRAGLPLWRLLGGYSTSVRCYAGGIDLHLEGDALLATVDAAITKGQNAYKIKVGRDNLAEDVARLTAVRRHVGDDFTLMIDANMKYRASEAITAARAFQPAMPLWFEEPVVPEDIDGLTRVAQEGGLAVATGENFRSLWEFAETIKRTPISYPQPDVTNCGGVSAFMKIAALAEAFHLPIASHGAHDITVHLMAACPNASYLEAHGFGLDRYISHPLIIKDGFAQAPEIPGIGFTFDEEGLSAFCVSDQEHDLRS